MKRGSAGFVDVFEEWRTTMEVHFSLDDGSVDFTSTLSGHADVSRSAYPCDPQCRLVHAHWMLPAQRDHDYCKADGGQDVQDKTTQCDEIGYLLLKNDQTALFYTGIALEVFNILVSSLEGYASRGFTFISVRDQVLLTLMKLKTNREINVLGKQFCLSEGMAGRIISYWIDKLETVLQPLIPWLPRETIQATMPEAFKRNFPNTTCILQCCKSFVQKPQNLNSRGGHSPYYDTVKYLVAVAPCGLIMFISAAYGGRCSDKFITVDSGLLDKLKPGDEIVAGHGSSIRDLLLYERQVKLIISIPTGQQAAATGHVERALGRLKVYKIVSPVVSHDMAPKMNKILRICSALVNLR